MAVFDKVIIEGVDAQGQQRPILVDATGAISTTGSSGGGGGGASTIADGADVAQGAVADAIVAAGAVGTLSAKLRRLTSDTDAIKTSIAAATPAGEAHIGQVGGTTVPITANKTRPNDTNAYAANDAVNESTSAGTPWTFTGAARISGGSGLIIGVQAKCTDPAIVARFEVDLYTAAPAGAVNDNAEATQLVADIANFVGTIIVPALAKRTTNSTFAIARDNTICQPFKTSGSANLFGIVRILDADTPIAQSVLYITLDIVQD
jgi:hypothetical protein